MSTSPPDPEALSDLEALRLSIADVLAQECDSRAIHDFVDGKRALDTALFAQARDLGWLAIGLPEAYGGLGLGLAGLDVLHRALGRKVAPGPFIATLSAAQWLAEAASEAQKKTYLPRVAAGALHIALPAVPMDAPRLSCAGDRLSGHLPAVIGSAQDALVLTPARSAEGITGLALAEPAPGAFTAAPMWDRTRTVFSVTLSQTPVHAFIPDPDEAKAARLTRILALAAAADSLGAAQGASDQTTEYMKTRIQFDRPIGAFQALKHRMANIATQLATNAHLLAQALEASREDGPDADQWAALAKASLTEAASFVTADCIQLHGGVGFTWEFDLHLFLKRARLNEMLAGRNRDLRDLAAAKLAQAALANRTTAELGS